MELDNPDREILRRLAARQAEIAALPIHNEKIVMWSRLNDRQPVRPMVWINEICWNEMNVADELTLCCADPFAREVERELRRTIYQWVHLPADMIVEPVFFSPLVIHDTCFGIDEDVRIVKTDESNDVVSREFHPQIREEKDLEKIRIPELAYDAEATERNYQTLVEAFGDILPVQKRGVIHTWFAPWDELIRWWGVQEAMMDMILRPELVHAAMERLVGAYLARLRQWEELNVLALPTGNNRVGSGGLGYTGELPPEGFNPARVRPHDQWGCATAQIFAEVSPDMHEEFALQYERRWLERFGMNYYGCCEPLHLKLGILESVPRLRKISMSPWANVGVMVERVGGKLVLSHKPNPAVLATDDWHPEQARANMRAVLEQAEGCPMEIIMKDISTLRYDPRRLWEWAQIAMEEVETAAGI